MTDSKEIVRAYIEQVWMNHNLAAIDEFISPTYVQHARGVGQGRDGLRRFLEMLHRAFSDINYRVEDIIAEGDKVCWLWEIRCTHTGEFQAIPATGKQVVITGMEFVRVADKQIVEHWGEEDVIGLMQQLRG